MSRRLPSWSRWEHEVEADIETARLVKCSGRLDLFKGDVKSSTLLIDCKYTGSRGYVLTEDMWETLATWAMNETRVPAMAIEVNHPDEGNQRIAVLPSLVYLGMVGPSYIEEKRSYKSKRLSGGYIKDGDRGLVVGRHWLVVMPYERFVERVNEYEAE